MKELVRLEKLVEIYPINEAVIEWYMDALYRICFYNMSFANDQGIPKSRINMTMYTIDKTKELLKTYPSNEKLVKHYNFFMDSMSSIEARIQANIITNKYLNLLNENYKISLEEAIEYAEALTVISDYKGQKDIISNLEIIKKLLNIFPNVQKLVLYYADIIYGLAYKQNLKQAKNTIIGIYELTLKYPENEEIALIYQKAQSLLDQ